MKLPSNITESTIYQAKKAKKTVYHNVAKLNASKNLAYTKYNADPIGERKYTLLVIDRFDTCHGHIVSALAKGNSPYFNIKKIYRNYDPEERCFSPESTLNNIKQAISLVENKSNIVAANVSAGRLLPIKDFDKIVKEKVTQENIYTYADKIRNSLLNGTEQVRNDIYKSIEQNYAS